MHAVANTSHPKSHPRAHPRARYIDHTKIAVSDNISDRSHDQCMLTRKKHALFSGEVTSIVRENTDILYLHIGSVTSICYTVQSSLYFYTKKAF